MSNRNERTWVWCILLNDAATEHKLQRENTARVHVWLQGY